MRSPDDVILRFPNRLRILLLLLPTVIGIWILMTSMRQGPGVGGDATIYITSARNLLTGHGLGLINADGTFRLLPYFPPFYPLVLAALIGLGFSAETSAMLINLACFGAAILLLSWLIMKASRSLAAGMLVGLLLAGSPILIPAYSWAMSEPLSIFLIVVAFYLLHRSLISDRLTALVGSAVLAGLSLLTRYSMAAGVLTACLIVLFFWRGNWLKRFLSAIVYGLIAAIPIGIWLVIDLRKTNTVASRNLLGNINLGSEIARFFNQLKPLFLQWLLPDSFISRMPGSVGSIVTLAILLVIGISLICSLPALSKGKDDLEDRNQAQILVFTYALFFILYLLQIMLVSVTTFPPITIGPRMVLPAAIAALMVVAVPVGHLFSLKTLSPWIKWLALAGLLLFAAYSGLRGVCIARQNAIDGLGYNTVAWRNSQTIDYLASHTTPSDALVTNEETALLYLLGRASWPIREVYAREADPVYYSYIDLIDAEETDYGRELFQLGEALLVVFDNFPDQMADLYGSAAPERVAALLKGLTPIFKGDDGVIYQLDGKP
jgi:4-amino-4-deoxy-L-arabinose transferase-like glycosyltransferase